MKELRAQLAAVLDWSDAHVGLEKALDGLPAQLRGVRPEGLPHSAWVREVLLVADHTAYHVGQIVLVRRALKSW